MDFASVHLSHQAAHDIACHSGVVVEVKNPDRGLAIGNRRGAVHATDQTADILTRGAIQIGHERFILATHHEGTVDSAVDYIAKHAVVGALVAQVARTDIIDVQVLDEMALPVIVTDKRCNLVAYRHPNILFHVDIGLLLQRDIGNSGDEPRQIFGRVNIGVAVARRCGPHHVGPGPAEIQRPVITPLGTCPVVIGGSRICTRMATDEEPALVVEEVAIHPCVLGNRGC